MRYLKKVNRGIVSFLALLIGITAGLPLISPLTHAQNNDEAVLDEIVVTSRYREEKLQQTPIAITAVTSADIKVRDFSQAYEVSYVVPNASLRPTQAAFGNTMSAFIRGIGQYDFLAEFEPGVAIYFDDVLHPVTMGSMIDLLDLERVEVLRGPQGTLFGRGSLGGAIRFVSKQPQGDDTGNIEVTVGELDRVDLRASYDFALSNRLFARVSGVSKSRDGHQTVLDFACANPAQAGSLPPRVVNRQANCVLGTQGGEDVQGARGALRFAAHEDLDFTFTADYLNDDSEVKADTLVALLGPSGAFADWSTNYAERIFGVPYDSRFLPPNNYTTYATYEDPRSGLSFRPTTRLEQTGFSGKMDWNVNENLRTELILSTREFESQFATDADGSPLNEQTVDGRQDFDAFTGELRFSGRMADRLNWTVGLFYYDGNFKSAQTVSIPAFIFSGVRAGEIAGGATPDEASDTAAFVIDNFAKFLVNGFNVTDSQNTSVFAHGVYDLSDRLALTAGVRYSEDQKDEQFDNTIVVTSRDSKDDSVDWKVGIEYRLSEEILLYGSAATGYRPQAFNPRPFQVTQFESVDGDENVSYDIGIKGDYFDNRLRVNLAAFYIDYKKRILPVGGIECLLIPGSDPPQYDTVPAGTPGAITDDLGNICLSVTSRTFYQNIPAEVSGLEAEFQWRPTDELTVSGIYGYTKFDGDEESNPGLFGPTVTQIFSDEPIYVPGSNWTFGIAYEIPLANGGSVTPRVDVYGQTEICPTLRDNRTVATNAQRCADGYELVNVRIEWASPDDKWMIAAGVNNATGKDYFLNKFDLTLFGQPTIEGQPGRPSNWYTTFRRNF